MTTPLLTVNGLGKRFGGFVALADIDLEVAQGERLGLIGPNGSGKSTLVNCLCGTLRNDTGRVTFDTNALNGLSAHQRTRLGIARSFQLPRPFATLTLADNIRVPILYAANVKTNHHTTDPRRRCEELLDMVGLLPKADRKPADLTQIEMRKLELARAMASDPKLLIADEAMAGLSHQEVDDILATDGAARKAELDLLRDAFIPWLVSVGLNGQPLRRQASWTDLPQAARPLIDKFIDKEKEKDGCKEGCGRFGTRIDFYKTTQEAAKMAVKEEKPVFGLHVSVIFENAELAANVLAIEAGDQRVDDEYINSLKEGRRRKRFASPPASPNSRISWPPTTSTCCRTTRACSRRTTPA